MSKSMTELVHQNGLEPAHAFAIVQSEVNPR